MPADAKRREARKRKFGTQKAEVPPDGGLNIELDSNNGEEREEPPKKKSKLAETSQAAVEDEYTLEENDAQAPQKAQRFIVFIGTRHSCFDHLRSVS